MKNINNSAPITSKEYFLLMRLLQHLENEDILPVEDNVDWQDIYAKLNYNCLMSQEK